MPHTIMPLPFKPARLDGLSETLLASHYQNNYGGALRRLNAIMARIDQPSWATAPSYEINGLAREHLIAANSVRLHELYFDSLGGSGGPEGRLAEALARDFGSVAAWAQQFAAMGKALGGGSGWAVLVWSPRAGRLVNQWAADHTHALADSRPILALDMYEHAYHLDFGAAAGAYVDAFMKNIHWPRVAAKFDRALAENGPIGAATDASDSIAPEAVRASIESGRAPLLLDICLAEDLARRQEKLPAALVRAPERIADWADEIPKDRPVVAYCVYGFQVSRDAVAELRRRGVDAHAMAGGIAAWHAIGGAVEPLRRDSTTGEIS